MVKFSESFDEIKKDFDRNHIPSREPGFYDHQNFVRVERSNRDYLLNYARFVQTRAYTQDYIERAISEIPFITSIINQELIQDGRKGACVDVSMVLSRILEAEGFWNYIVNGSVVLNFAEHTHLSSKYFWAVDYINKHINGHVWVVAPPFSIIDATINLQPYLEGEEAYIPNLIVSVSSITSPVEIDDILSPAFRSKLPVGVNTPSLISRYIQNPHWYTITDTFPTTIIEEQNVSLKYIPYSIHAPDRSLQGIGSLILSGKKPYELYQKVVKPALRERRRL